MPNMLTEIPAVQETNAFLITFCPVNHKTYTSQQLVCNRERALHMHPKIKEDLIGHK